MTVGADINITGVPHGGELRYDSYDVELNFDPHPMFSLIRENAPLYYNAEHDFYALSRFADVGAALLDHETFSSARGAVLEIIKSGMDIPPGTLIFEDPPIHNIHRQLLSRIFTPRKVAALKPKVREYTARCLDPRGYRPVRLRQGPGCADADAGHRLLLGIPRRTSSTSSTTVTPRSAPSAAVR